MLSQQNAEVEYIIVDGASTDGTLSIIRGYQENHTIRLLSEPDKGLYDAMNKGVGLATGDYIQFLNAGDTYLSDHTLVMVEQKLQEKLPDFTYGHIRYCNADGTSEIRKYGAKCGKSIYFLTGDCINHQAVFAKCSLFQYNQFDVQYHICADREWMMRLKKKQHIDFTPIDQVICNYSLDENSVSIRNKSQYNLEAAKCIRDYYPCGYPIFCLFEFCRHNEMLGRLLHAVYRRLYIKK